MDWTKACWAHELAGRLSDGAVWLLKSLYSVNKSSRIINRKRVAKLTYIPLSLERVDLTLDDVLKELADEGFLVPLGGKKYEKTSEADAVEHVFRNALALGVLQGDIGRDQAELPDGIRIARLIVELKCEAARP